MHNPLVATAHLPYGRSTHQALRRIEQTVFHRLTQRPIENLHPWRVDGCSEINRTLILVIDGGTKGETSRAAVQRPKQGRCRGIGNEIVGVDELDIGLIEQRNGTIGGVRGPPVLLSLDNHVALGGGRTLDNFQRIVRRAVVDEHVLSRKIARLSRNLPQHPIQTVGLVVDRYDNGDAGKRHHPPLREPFPLISVGVTTGFWLSATARCRGPRSYSPRAFGSAPDWKQLLTTSGVAVSKNELVFRLSHSTATDDPVTSMMPRTQTAAMDFISYPIFFQTRMKPYGFAKEYCASWQSAERLGDSQYSPRTPGSARPRMAAYHLGAGKGEPGRNRPCPEIHRVRRS